MGKTILVTGKDTFLGNEIIQILQGAGNKIASTVQPRPDSTVHWDIPDQHLVLPWNRRSSLSSKNLLSDILARFGTLDEVWLVLSPELDSRPAGAVPLVELDEKLDLGVKGFFCLLRELTTYGKINPHLEINFVLFRETSHGIGPLSSCIYSGFKGLGQGTIQTSRDKVRGFEASGQSGDAFLRFLQEEGFNHKAAWGQWHILQEKRGFFPGSKGGN
ncbi:MAG: hypothetical protein A2Z96_07195 [Spirochaetes bacterium GWB1_48_6]|nr:MAG: hypothetical protein A2Z96_07195 [Spirochaetes bacterium GWB1_48_6]